MLDCRGYWDESFSPLMICLTHFIKEKYIWIWFGEELSASNC
jgi:hypothetical protein